MNQEIFKFQEEKTVRATYNNDGILMYCLSDIAYCLGNKNPTKFASDNNISKIKMDIKWQSGSKTGKSKMHVLPYRSLLILADKYQWSETFMNWLRDIEKAHQVNNNPTIKEDIDFDALNEMMDTIVYACLDLRKKITAYEKMYNL